MAPPIDPAKAKTAKDPWIDKVLAKDVQLLELEKQQKDEQA
jgi:hypothetical protein